MTDLWSLGQEVLLLVSVASFLSPASSQKARCSSAKMGGYQLYSGGSYGRFHAIIACLQEQLTECSILQKSHGVWTRGVLRSLITHHPDTTTAY